MQISPKVLQDHYQEHDLFGLVDVLKELFYRNEAVLGAKFPARHVGFYFHFGEGVHKSRIKSMEYLGLQERYYVSFAEINIELASKFVAAIQGRCDDKLFAAGLNNLLDAMRTKEKWEDFLYSESLAGQQEIERNRLENCSET